MCGWDTIVDFAKEPQLTHKHHGPQSILLCEIWHSQKKQDAKHGTRIPDLVVHTLTVPTNISAGIVVMIPEYWTRHTRVSSVPISQVQEGREHILCYRDRTPCSYYLTINPKAHDCIYFSDC